MFLQRYIRGSQRTDSRVRHGPFAWCGGAARRWRRGPARVRLRGMGAADRARARLVDGLRDRGRLCGPAVEAAFRDVPRHLFLPAVPLVRAYADEAVAVQAVDGVTTSSAS